MLNFEMFLYRNIGLKIRKYRKKQKLNQKDFSANLQSQYHISIDEFRISTIENGRIHKKKNPYLLTDQQIETFTRMIGCDKKEFIFGDYKEREENVKLFLLALIMNSDKNKENKHVTPFINGLFKYKDKKDFVNDNEIGEISGNLDKVSKEIIEIKNKLKRLYPFFANERVSEKYQNILHKQSSEIELFSNLLIKLMFGDYGFTNLYILKVQENCERNKSNEIAYSFLLNKGTIAARLIEGKNGIYVFANAFERMWERHKGYFVEFFNKYLFNEVEKDDFKF